MANKTKILVVPAGSGMAIMAIKALKQDEDITVLSADTDKLAPGLYLAHKGFLLPPFSDESFFDKLKELVERERISVIIPALDSILLEFAEKIDEFRQLGVEILSSEPDTIRVTRDKWETYLCLKDVAAMPKSFVEKQKIDIDYPLFIKPRDGSGSKQVYIIRSDKELNFFFDYVKSPIIQELLPGAEYTVDCLADMQGNLLACVPRRRFEIRDGITTKALIIQNSELVKMGSAISKKLKFRGPFFFQAKEDEYGKTRLMEVNARIGGTMCHKSFLKGNFHTLSVKLAMGKKVTLPQIRYGVYITRFWEEIYLTNGKSRRNSRNSYIL
jgi:carbamoyl-phosphate synthase large subunit